MSSELEAAAADSVGSFLRRKPKHMLPIGSPCPNCATALEGAWCHSCGQRAEDYHRSITRLGWEAVEGFFELDGRLLRTVPRLAMDPGGLTSDYIHGHRAPQIPPFRLFLVVVVIVFLAGSLSAGSNNNTKIGTPAQVAASKAKADAETARKLKEAGVSIDANDKGARIDMPGVHISASDSDEPKAKIEKKKSAKAAAASSDAESKTYGSERSGVVLDGTDEEVRNNPFLRWMAERANVISSNEDAFFDSLQEWGHRLAILALPMSAAILGLMFVWRRRFFIYDHLIFSMHSLAFQGLLLSTIMLGTALFHNGVFWLLILAAPVHLFIHMRKVYGRGVITTLLRMFVLFIFSCIGGSLIMMAVFFLTLNDLSSKVGKTPDDKPAETTMVGKAAKELAADARESAREDAAEKRAAAKKPPSKDSN